MNITEAIETLKKEVPDARQGLPEDLFYYISTTTPLVNVDLLIQDEKGRTLLSWRDDPYCGQGWHIPGGIVRFQETLEDRLQKVAENEIGTKVDFDPTPLTVNQCIHPQQDIRSHFISILYKCSLSASFVPQNKGLAENDSGYLKWHDGCPDNFLKVHEMYACYLT